MVWTWPSDDDSDIVGFLKIEARDNALLQNFYGSAAPTTPAPIAGMLWADSVNSLMKAYFGGVWVAQATKPYVDATFLPLAGGAMTGPIVLSADPAAALQPATKQYVDNKIDGVKWKPSVRAATVVDGTLASSFENGDVIDGVTLATGDRILIKNQSAGAENGIYIVAASGAPARAADADTSAEMLQATCYVQEGTINADTEWTCSNNTITLGSTALVFVQRAGAGTYTADESTLTLSTTVFSIKPRGVGYANMPAATAQYKFLARKSASGGDWEECSFTEALDFVTSAAQGDILYRGASAWARLPAGTSGQYLKTNGAGANPGWAGATALNGVPVGSVLDFAGVTLPTLYLWPDGAAISRSTYSEYFAIATRAATVTVTIASPAVVSWTGHGLSIGDQVSFETTGALPTGLSVGVHYYVIAAGFGANSFQVSTSRGGSAVNTSGSQSGVQTCRFVPFGCGDGSTTFNKPDLRGRTTIGRDDMGGTAISRITAAVCSIFGINLGAAGGDQNTQQHTHTATQGAHTHTYNDPANGIGTGNNGAGTQGTFSANTSAAAPAITVVNYGSGASQNVQPGQIMNKILYVNA